MEAKAANPKQVRVGGAPVPLGAHEATKIDGNATSATIKTELKEEIRLLKEQHGIVPGLGVVLIGARPDSSTYVRMKKKAAEDVGINFTLKEGPETITEEELIKMVTDLNEDDKIHGIIVQLPLPAHINERKILDLVLLDKDVDGFHPHNIGSLALKGRDPLFVPCTPKGCMELLKRYNIPTDGKRAVVLGRSNIVGVPISLLLMHANATVTICHSRTPNIAEICKEADIVIAAIGQPEKQVTDLWEMLIIMMLKQ
eukprot:TRINITY_DN2065_c0_g1_i2.p1 TRINITY_DN2065_c0_g1~~TRINITY_DN2065_c0_g1_i2.p1  ORF type:complete len:256 (-),score=60.56 TRINITY_DN2065_c0_g1_i2:99-866(-)